MAAQSLRFADLIDMIDRLPLEERESLVEVVRRRNCEDQRKRIAASIRSARREHRLGKCNPTSAEELMREIAG